MADHPRIERVDTFLVDLPTIPKRRQPAAVLRAASVPVGGRFHERENRLGHIVVFDIASS